MALPTKQTKLFCHMVVVNMYCVEDNNGRDPRFFAYDFSPNSRHLSYRRQYVYFPSTMWQVENLAILADGR
jgi:hypothetical protein